MSLYGQVSFLIGGHWLSPGGLLVFFATLGIYAIHRWTGLRVVFLSDKQSRFNTISKYKAIIIVSGYIGLLCGGILFFQLPVQRMVYYIIPALLSIFYVLPSYKNKRLRDYSYIKIFVISFVWAYITVYIPAVTEQGSMDASIKLLFIEKACFIFAITLPFDIRDYEIDLAAKVMTLAHVFGKKGTVRIASSITMIAILLMLYNWHNDLYTTLQMEACFLSYLVVFILLACLHEKRQEWYYSGLMDGTIFLQSFLIFLVS